jgi:hypothetical protein
LEPAALKKLLPAAQKIAPELIEDHEYRQAWRAIGLRLGTASSEGSEEQNDRHGQSEPGGFVGLAREHEESPERFLRKESAGILGQAPTRTKRVSHETSM